MDVAAGRREPVEHPGRRRRRVGLHPRARHGQRVEGGAEMPGRLDADRVAEMAVETGRELAAVDEQPDAAVVAQDREGQRQRRVRHVAAADIEQPGDRLRASSAPRRRLPPRRGRGPGGRACRRRSRRRSGRDAARPGRAARPAVPARPGRPDCRRPRAGSRRRARRRPAAARPPAACAARGRSRGRRPCRARCRATAPAAPRSHAGSRTAPDRPARRPATCSGRRRTARRGPCSTIAIPAEPVNPVSHARRWAQAGTYSPWCSSERGTMNPSRPARRQFLAQHARPAPGAAAARNPPARDRRASPRRDRRASLRAPRRAPAGSDRRPDACQDVPISGGAASTPAISSATPSGSSADPASRNNFAKRSRFGANALLPFIPNAPIVITCRASHWSQPHGDPAASGPVPAGTTIYGIGETSQPHGRSSGRREILLRCNSIAPIRGARAWLNCDLPAGCTAARVYLCSAPCWCQE